MLNRIKIDYTRHSIQISKPLQADYVDYLRPPKPLQGEVEKKHTRESWAKEVTRKMGNKKHWHLDQYIHLREQLFETITEKEIAPQTVRAINSLHPKHVQWWTRYHKTVDNSDGNRPYADLTMPSGRRFIIGRLGYNSGLSKMHVLLPRGAYLPCPSLGDACMIVRALDDIKYAPLLIGSKSERYAKRVLSGELTY